MSAIECPCASNRLASAGKRPCLSQRANDLKPSSATCVVFLNIAWALRPHNGAARNATRLRRRSTSKPNPPPLSGTPVKDHASAGSTALTARAHAVAWLA